ncbi:MAG: hypothetical protein ACODAB_10470, partial [Gemmatimonadota bacterium]
MTAGTFYRATVAGLIATFVMTLTGFWMSGLGLPQLDVGGMIAESTGHGWTWGNFAHFVNGALLALIYVQWVRDRLPGNALVRGIGYGILTTLAAAIVVVPLAADAGIFFSNTPMPGAMVAASTVAHLAFGLSLEIAYGVAER